MQRIIILLTIWMSFSSCSLPLTKINNNSQPFPDDSPQLKNIVIRSFDTQKFRGLLGVAEQQGNLLFLLLDATGLKLLEVEVQPDGDATVKGGIERLMNSGLPEILAKTLRNVYIVEPAELPCSTHFLQKICREQLDSFSQVKYTHNGPFTRWKVHYEIKDDFSITYTEPWVGLQIEISDMKNSLR